MTDRSAVVAQAKKDLLLAGKDITGPCGAFSIVALAVWRMRAEGAGLLIKTGGNNCNGYATDIICYPDGHIYDVLFGAGDENGPTWQDKEFVSIDRYHAAIPVDDPTGPVDPPSPVEELRARLTAIDQKLDLLVNGLAGYFGGHP